MGKSLIISLSKDQVRFLTAFLPQSGCTALGSEAIPVILKPRTAKSKAADLCPGLPVLRTQPSQRDTGLRVSPMFLPLPGFTQ